MPVVHSLAQYSRPPSWVGAATLTTGCGIGVSATSWTCNQVNVFEGVHIAEPMVADGIMINEIRKEHPYTRPLVKWNPAVTCATCLERMKEARSLTIMDDVENPATAESVIQGQNELAALRVEVETLKRVARADELLAKQLKESMQKNAALANANRDLGVELAQARRLHAETVVIITGLRARVADLVGNITELEAKVKTEVAAKLALAIRVTEEHGDALMLHREKCDALERVRDLEAELAER